VTPSDLLARVLALASETAGPARTPGGLGPDTPLAGGGFWLDSVGLLELILACEREFGVELDPVADLDPASLRTVRALVSVLETKLSR
jgi:acyl carrier protein